MLEPVAASALSSLDIMPPAVPARGLSVSVGSGGVRSAATRAPNAPSAGSSPVSSRHQTSSKERVFASRTASWPA
jgi:hypothetical protein